MVRRDEEQWEPLDSLGETGATVARNVRMLRLGRGLAYTELAVILGAIGREIPTWGLRKIESGGRRVDADDLVALARALNVSPATLLMPLAEGPEVSVTVTGVDGTVSARRVWEWLMARQPLVDDSTRESYVFLYRAVPGWLFDEGVEIFGPDMPDGRPWRLVVKREQPGTAPAVGAESPWAAEWKDVQLATGRGHGDDQ